MSGENEEVSLRDEIQAVYKDTNAKAEDVSNEEVIDKLEKPRDDKGKFAAKEEDKDAEVTEQKVEQKPDTKAEPAEEDASGKVTLSKEKAPSSWSPTVREKWGELPEDVRAEIVRREEASAGGVRQLHEEYRPIKQFAEALSPFIQEAVNNGLNPTEYIGNVMAAERNLRSPNKEQRFNALLSIADQYGIPLREVINASVGEEVLQRQAPAQAELPAHIAQQLQRQDAQLREMQEANFKKEIDAFKGGHEFFDDVSEAMADLIDAGRAKGLEDAYEQACWMHPEVRRVMLDRERTGGKQDELKQRQAAASKATVKASGAADIKVDTDDDDTLESTVRKAITEASGRI